MRWAGTPNRLTQPAKKASAQSWAVVLCRGTASGQRVVRSTMVSTCEKPSLLGGKGPTRSTWTWANQWPGTAIGCRGAFMCRTTLAAAQPWQSRHQAAASLAIPLHTYLLASNGRVARMPG